MYQEINMEDFLATVLPRPADMVGHSEAVTQILFCDPKFCCAQKTCFEHMIKIKIFPPQKMYFAPNLKTWLRAWSCENCVCN